MFTPYYPPFRPFWGLENPHIQTILPFFRPHPPSPQHPTQRWVVRLPDDDVLVIHDNRPPNWITGDRVVILVHGLGGSHRSPFLRRVAEKLRRAGCRTFRVDLRGVGDARELSRGHCHAAATPDLEAIVRAVAEMCPLSRVTLVGFSLGGNLVLKWAGQGDHVVKQPVDSVIAVAPPVDLIECSANLRQWGNRFYDHFFCWNLQQLLTYRRKHVPGLYDNGLKKLPNRLVHFDDQFVAPVSGYRGAREYYQAASSASTLRDINLPTLIVTAADDPIVPEGMLRNWRLSSAIEWISVPHGGHLGFLGSTRGDPDSFWLDWRLVRWIRDWDDHARTTYRQDS